MEREAEYDPVSGVEVEICRTCEELTNNLRTQAANLRRFDNLQTRHGVPGYEGLRQYLIRARDSVFEGLSRHQRLHSGELDESEM